MHNPRSDGSAKPDWRIGLKVTPKMKDNPLFGEVGIIIDVYPDGSFGMDDPNGILAVQMLSGLVLHRRAEDFKTA